MTLLVKWRAQRIATAGRIAALHDIALCAALCLALTSSAQETDKAAPEPVARDLRETVVRVDVTVEDRFGRSETKPMPITVFRPDGDGPFPLVVFDHGRATADKRAAQGRARFEAVARYFVTKGFVVLVPTRIGYWETYAGGFDPEESGTCNDLRLQGMADATSAQTLAAVEYAKSLPYVDAKRWVVAGVSVGGLATVATVARQPPGLIGGINFSGGSGGDPEKHPARPCSPQRVEALYRRLGADTTVPMLWMYWDNDLYWGGSVPRTWFAAWKSGGGQGTFDAFPARGDDGHAGVNIDLDHWMPAVDGFLAALGFAASPPLERPAATRFADLDAIDRLPVDAPAARAAYRKFLEAPAPRAFAIGDRGAYGFATKDAVLFRALGSCTRSGQRCKLYAVDGDVVWR